MAEQVAEQEQEQATEKPEEALRYSSVFMDLLGAIRAYVDAGDTQDKKAQKDTEDKISHARKELARLVGDKCGALCVIQYYSIIREWCVNIRRLADAGDTNLRDVYGKALNTLLRNIGKHMAFIKSHLDPGDDAAQSMEQAQRGMLIHLSGFVRCRDTGKTPDDVQHWAEFEELGRQFGSQMDGLLMPQGRGESVGR